LLANPCSSILIVLICEEDKRGGNFSLSVHHRLFIGILLVLVVFVTVVFGFVVGNGVGREIDGGGKFGVDVIGFFLVYGGGGGC
jgi:hypothetical protein